MDDDTGNELEVGSTFEFEGMIDGVSGDIPLEKDTVLYEGEYMVYVPPGQKATVVFTLAVNEEEETSPCEV